MSARKRYWLLKTEPEVFSWQDLVEADGQTTFWDGVRNYQARNFMRDDMRPGDGVLWYHSRGKEPAVVGQAEVASRAEPDPTQFDPASPYHDPKSPVDDPRWCGVRVKAVRALAAPVTLAAIKAEPGLAEMPLVQRGQRLSVQPVTADQWRAVLRLGGIKTR
ncbi:MAG: EVE domain-containing protein [Planctomycetota bacterium]